MTNPYRALPGRAFRRCSVTNVDPALVDPVTDVPFKISRQDKVATAGSCFAQHISRTLVREGFNYLAIEHASSEEDVESYQAFSAGYGNIYTARQLLQLFNRAYGIRRPADTVWRRDDGAFVDPFRPHIRKAGFATVEELHAARRQHLACVRRVFEDCDVFIFTLGLTESWVSKLDGTVVPLAPGVSGASEQGHAYQFENITLDEIFEDTSAFIKQLREVNPGSRVILTVSPVPLIATYEDRHVLVSNTLSKATLRLAADTVSHALPNVAYFPSYEIITGAHTRGRSFAEDLRSVTEEGVRHVMRIFAQHFLTDATLEPFEIPKAEATAACDENGSADKRYREIQVVICDEEAFDP